MKQQGSAHPLLMKHPNTDTYAKILIRSCRSIDQQNIAAQWY